MGYALIGLYCFAMAIALVTYELRRKQESLDRQQQAMWSELFRVSAYIFEQKREKYCEEQAERLNTMMEDAGEIIEEDLGINELDDFPH